MKTKIFLTGIALSFAAVAFAQETPVLEQQIKDYSAKIDSIVVSEKAKMNDELDAVDKNFKAGRISETEKDAQRAEIAARYETAINDKVNAERSSFEEITQKTVKNAVMGTEDRELKAANKTIVTVKDGEKKTHPKDVIGNSGFVLSFGWLNLTNKDAPLNFFNDSSEIRFGQSMSVNYAIKADKQMGSYTSPVFLTYGAGIRADSHDLGKGRVFAQQNNELYIAPFTAGEIKYSQLKVEYLEIPLDISFVLNPKYVDYEGVKYLDGTKRQFRVGAGLYGDIRIGNRIKYRYSDDISSKNVIQQKAEDGLSKFIYGAKLSVGYGGLNLFVKKDFNTIFDSKARMDNKYGLQIGLELASINF